MHLPRLAIPLIAAALGSPAAAQVTIFEVEALRAQQEAAHRRSIDLDNRLQAEDARRRAEDAALAAEIQRGPARAPELRYELASTPKAQATPACPSIPDEILVESNRRVRDAAGNRR